MSLAAGNFEAFRKAVTGFFQTSFVGTGVWVLSGSPPNLTLSTPSTTAAPFAVEFDNSPFRRPDGLPWGRFAIRHGTRENLGIGGKEARTLGFISLQIFCPEGKGTKPATLAADLLAEAFDNLTLDISLFASAIFRTVSHNAVGLTGDGWFQVNASCPYQFDEIIPPNVHVDEPGGAVFVNE